jgi:Fe-S-cluster containining protein
MNASHIMEAISVEEEGVLVGTRSLITLVQNRASDPEKAERSVRHERHVLKAQSDAMMPFGRIAELLHRRIDRAMVANERKHPDVAKQVSCRRGCSHCCYMLVSVSEPEAQLALDAARKAGHSIDMERARRQASLSNYNELPHDQRRCVMLRDDRDCAIYEHRPLACRAYRVITPADDCDIEKHPGGGTLVWHTFHAEVVASASMRTFRHGSLAAFVATSTTTEGGIDQ